MKPTDRVLHHTMAGCTDPQRAGVIDRDIEGGHLVRWHIKYLSGVETDILAWYEPQELIPFVETENEEADRQREFNWLSNKVIEEAKVGA